MIAETGHYALILALAVAIVQMLLPLVGARLRDPQLSAIAVPAAKMQFVLIAIAFAALTAAYVTSDFSVKNVWQNSHSAKPLLYKISGVWGNHEGSMVLWVLILALFGASVATFGANLPRELKANVLAVQGSIAAAFLLFIIVTSNPFIRLDPAPFDGEGLNPVLQDPALSFHPPFLYAGYVGFSMAFSFAVAALIDGRIDAAWARWVRPWTLAAWMCLTLGIAMGSWWAYYELGWGGFWFWDPVENASFMPWLAGTALLHSALVMEKRDALKVWTILLAIITFSLSLMGTFLVRSGVLTSVHTFAVDPARGVFILAIMGVLHRRSARALCLARAAPVPGRIVRTHQPRRRARVQQSPADHGLRRGLRRHALSARARSDHRGENLGRRALLQSDLRADHGPASHRDAVRAAARVEAGRHGGGGATPHGGGGRRACGDPGAARGVLGPRPVACAVRHRARPLACDGRAVGDRLPRETHRGRSQPRFGAASAICRVRLTDRRWRMRGSGSP